MRLDGRGDQPNAITTTSLAFGLGVSFLIFGYPLVKDIAPGQNMLGRAAHLAITWLLINWWFHDSLHIHNGMNLNGLLAIEYGFHVTLMIARTSSSLSCAMPLNRFPPLGHESMHPMAFSKNRASVDIRALSLAKIGH